MLFKHYRVLGVSRSDGKSCDPPFNLGIAPTLDACEAIKANYDMYDGFRVEAQRTLTPWWVVTSATLNDCGDWARETHEPVYTNNDVPDSYQKIPFFLGLAEARRLAKKIACDSNMERLAGCCIEPFVRYYANAFLRLVTPDEIRRRAWQKKCAELQDSA